LLHFNGLPILRGAQQRDSPVDHNMLREQAQHFLRKGTAPAAGRSDEIWEGTLPETN